MVGGVGLSPLSANLRPNHFLSRQFVIRRKTVEPAAGMSDFLQARLLARNNFRIARHSGMIRRMSVRSEKSLGEQEPICRLAIVQRGRIGSSI